MNKGHRIIAGSSDYTILNTIIMVAVKVYTPINIILRFSFLFVLIIS